MKDDSEQKVYNDDVIAYVKDLYDKAVNCNAKTESHSNCDLVVNDYKVPLRVDDVKLLGLAAKLVPNIVNYLVNNLPYLCYPYICAFLNDLQQYQQDITINDLFDIVDSF